MCASFCLRKFGRYAQQYLTEISLNHVSLVIYNYGYVFFTDCPAVIPRCLWEAKPYKGTPTLLQPPLPHVYIHHTYEPSKPCVSFQDCAADMRNMQILHQVERGWDDIGYR